MAYFGQDSTSQTGAELTAVGTTAASLTATINYSPVDTTLHLVDAGINSAASIVATIPGAGPIIAGVLEIGEAVLNVIGIRSGADEANVITKVQTPLTLVWLPQINAAIPYANIQQLQTMYAAVLQNWNNFKAFVAEPIFTDGRASKQALNSVGPVMDGTGDYTSKDSPPGCYHCGPAGGGEDGVMGSIQRQILSLGGTMISTPPQVTQGAMSSYYPTLESPNAGDYGGSNTVQAGTLPLYPASSLTPMQPAIVSTGFFGAGNTPLIVGAVLLFLFLRKRS